MKVFCDACKSQWELVQAAGLAPFEDAGDLPVSGKASDKTAAGLLNCDSLARAVSAQYRAKV